MRPDAESIRPSLESIALKVKVATNTSVGLAGFCREASIVLVEELCKGLEDIGVIVVCWGYFKGQPHYWVRVPFCSDQWIIDVTVDQFGLGYPMILKEGSKEFLNYQESCGVYLGYNQGILDKIRKELSS